MNLLTNLNLEKISRTRFMNKLNKKAVLAINADDICCRVVVR